MPFFCAHLKTVIETHDNDKVQQRHDTHSAPRNSSHSDHRFLNHPRTVHAIEPHLPAHAHSHMPVAHAKPQALNATDMHTLIDNLHITLDSLLLSPTHSF
jgi:hypothetical protein